MLGSAESKQYLIYALAGRSLIEQTATLRWYVTHEYKPLFDRGAFTHTEYRKLLDIDDRHLRGGRFDWTSFFLLDYRKLKDDAVKQLTSKKAKQHHVAQGIIAEQINVVTCVERWAATTPEILIAYNLSCDLVHPNIGSSFLVASTAGTGLHFTPTTGEDIGSSIFRQTFPILASVVLNPFAEALIVLAGTIWQDDELQDH